MSPTPDSVAHRTPSASPFDSSSVSSDAWQDYKRGLLTWPELQRLEAEVQPVCFVCGERTNGRIGLGCMCSVCLTRLAGLVADAWPRIIAGRL